MAKKDLKLTNSVAGCMPTMLYLFWILRGLFFLVPDRYGVILIAEDRYESTVMVDGFICQLFSLSNDVSNFLLYFLL